MGRAIGKLVDIRLAKFFIGRACQRFLNLLDWGRRPDKARPVGIIFNRSGITLSSQSSIALNSELRRVISSHWWGYEVQTTSQWTEEDLKPD